MELIDSPVTRRRLDDGKRAIELSLPKSKAEATNYVSKVRSAIAALQSLDDLGSALNKKVMRDMDELFRRLKSAEKKFKV